MKANLIEFANYFALNVTKQAAIARHKIEELMQKEELYSKFLKLQGVRPSDDDCSHFKSLTVKRMKGVNDLLISGFSLEKLKQYSIWKGKA